ncbi:uncharacterized protein LOC127842997 [Dreissena polymorpha]|uniref:uncharacterized protein LOC127842997 n=1 Tax=Dreissena polymorpha TaxID=45954 RepID=UPI002263E73C|nr:uncharacterized protein LOC127842997 [Dreissena polymorpha]
MLSPENAIRVRELFDRQCEKYEEFKTVHFQYFELCEDPETKVALQESFESCKTNFVEFKERYSQWTHTEVDSLSSAASSTSRLKHAKVKRLIAEQKLKTLKEQQSLEKERLKLESLQKELQDKTRLLAQESVVTEAKLEESVWADEDTVIHEYDVHREHTSPIIETDRASTSRRLNGGFTDNRNAADEPSSERVSVTQRDSRHSASGMDVEKLASILQEGFNLPKPELLTFSGSPLDYCKFIKNVETNVECKVSDNRLNLSYLIQYCTGEARSCIDDCVLLDANVGYSKAKSILQSRYGRPRVIARSHIDKLLHGPPVKASDVNELSKLALDMQKCQITLSQFVSDIDNSENLR